MPNIIETYFKVLHEAGTKLNKRDHKGRTPLLLAAVLDRSVAASRLLDYGAKAGIIDETGGYIIPFSHNPYIPLCLILSYCINYRYT